MFSLEQDELEERIRTQKRLINDIETHINTQEEILYKEKTWLRELESLYNTKSRPSFNKEELEKFL